MPTADKHRDRIVPIEFSETENMEALPQADRLTLVLVTNGRISYTLNGKTDAANAPALLSIGAKDDISIIEKNHFGAKSFSFAPTFVNTSLTFEALSANRFSCLEDEHDRYALLVFLARNDYYTGRLELTNTAYLQILQWLDNIGREIYVQSDCAWTCRIRRWLLQILYLEDDIMSSGITVQREQTPEEIAYEYINTNYKEDITLDMLCKASGVNRTTLAVKFKSRFGVTISKYLQDRRIKMACEILAHTNLSLSEIAEETGFKYDTYFIKRFTKLRGISPTDYRNEVRERAPGLSKRKRAVQQ